MVDLKGVAAIIQAFNGNSQGATLLVVCMFLAAQAAVCIYAAPQLLSVATSIGEMKESLAAISMTMEETKDWMRTTDARILVLEKENAKRD